MIYLNDNDLKSKLFEIFIIESSADYEEVINDIELQNIALMKSKLSGRFNVKLLFDKAAILVTNEALEDDDKYEVDAEGRHSLILKVLIALVAYQLIRRNAARKIPSDLKDDYKWAMDWLKYVHKNMEHPTGLPPKLDEGGKVKEFIKHGNNKNENYYL